MTKAMKIVYVARRESPLGIGSNHRKLNGFVDGTQPIASRRRWEHEGSELTAARWKNA
jgi:hypothetical protein